MRSLWDISQKKLVKVSTFPLFNNENLPTQEISPLFSSLFAWCFPFETRYTDIINKANTVPSFFNHEFLDYKNLVNLLCTDHSLISSFTS